MDDVKITAPNTGKHIAIAGGINSILASKDDTNGTCSVVEAKYFPVAVQSLTFKLVNMRDSMFLKVK